MAKYCETYYVGCANNHFDGNRFYLDGHDSRLSFMGILSFLLDRPIIPEWCPITINTSIPEKCVQNLRVTYIGQSAFLIQVNTINILTDPVYAQYLGWPLDDLIPKRTTQPGIKLEDLPTIHLILITHDHQDHLDFDFLRWIIPRCNPVICTPLGFRPLLFQKGIPINNVVEMDWHQSYQFNKETCIFFEPAYHWSGRNFIFDKDKRLWGSFVIKSKNDTIYVSGDTDLFDGKIFHDAYKRFSPIKLALLPIGGYKPCILFRHVHAAPEDIVKIHKILKPEWSISMHCDTYQRLTNEDYKEPEYCVKRVLEKENIHNFKFLPIGEPWDIYADAECHPHEGEDPCLREDDHRI